MQTETAHTEFPDYTWSAVIFNFKNTMKSDEPPPPQTNSTFFLNHLGCNEAPII